MRERDVAMLLSIRNKIAADYPGDVVRYTEMLVMMGSDFARILRVEVSPQLAVIYDSEKTRLRKFDRLFYGEAGRDIEKTVIEYLKT